MALHVKQLGSSLAGRSTCGAAHMLLVAMLQPLSSLTQQAGRLVLRDALLLAHTVQQAPIGQVLHTSAAVSRGVCSMLAAACCHCWM